MSATSHAFRLCGPAKSLQLAMMSYENKLTRQAPGLQMAVSISLIAQSSSVLAIKQLNVETADIRCSLARLEARKLVWTSPRSLVQ